jgi:hypothetical protein
MFCHLIDHDEPAAPSVDSLPAPALPRALSGTGPLASTACIHYTKYQILLMSYSYSNMLRDLGHGIETLCMLKRIVCLQMDSCFESFELRILKLILYVRRVHI